MPLRFAHSTQVHTIYRTNFDRNTEAHKGDFGRDVASRIAGAKEATTRRMLRAPRTEPMACVVGVPGVEPPRRALAAKTWLALVAQFRAASLPFSHPGVNSL